MRNMWLTLVKYVGDGSESASVCKNAAPILFINTPVKGVL